ncbi:MAG: putative Fe-S cluster assembly protein SufT [Gammaproteobacteria bacterium]|nr:MAG: putative Fe-S cluster assembly protein SufT [Gammaproteobacteria bacterium]
MNSQVSSSGMITLNRDCDAVLIPVGEPITLKKGTQVMITQSLGGSYTVNIDGNLARIAEKDADALGYEKKEAIDQPRIAEGPVEEEALWEQLRTCYDPEIPINIVDLGLVYECRVDHDEENRTNHVHVKMTLTAPGCGMGPFLVEDARNKLLSVKNVTDVHVELVFDPPWNQDMMSQAARLQTGML